MYFRILFFSYLKNFLIIFFSLVAFFIFMDFMINKSKLPDSTNLQILYIFYNSANAALLIYPLSLLLAVLVTVINLVKKNEMIAFLSLGYSLKKLLFPVFTLSFFVTMFFIFIQLNTTSSFYERAKSILSGKYFSNVNENLFFRFNNNIIFIKKLDVVRKKATDMRIFRLNKNNLDKVYEIKEAIFKDNVWKSKEVIEHKFLIDRITTKKLKIDLLRGFKPDILNKLESKQAMTLKIAIESLYLLKKENINVNFIKTYIYNAIIPPLSFILLIIIVFLKSPIHSRISNVSLYIAISVFSAVILWGVFLLIRKMTIAGVISPDIVFITPFVLLLSFTIYYFRKI